MSLLLLFFWAFAVWRLLALDSRAPTEFPEGCLATTAFFAEAVRGICPVLWRKSPWLWLGLLQVRHRLW